jgi:GNAT superfamily N-acetyltransferase
MSAKPILAMSQLTFRPASIADKAFAFEIAAACIKPYAERTWGRWDGRVDLEIGRDKVIQFAGTDIGLIGVEKRTGSWFLSRLYIAPNWQRRGLGSMILGDLLREARAAGVSIRLTVLEVNPARALYERHGFRVVETRPPRHHMAWSPI